MGGGRGWRGRTGRSVLLGAMLGLVGAVALSGPAWAHATLESTDPVQSSVVPGPPSQVVLHFDESVEIDFGSVQVVGPGGGRVDAGGATHPGGDASAVAVPLPRRLARGTYVVAWRVISADSHPVHGAFEFSIGAAGAPGAAQRRALTASGGSPVVGVAGWLLRLLVDTSLLVLVGLGLLRSPLAPLATAPSLTARRSLWAAWWVLLAGTVAAVAVQGAYAAALPLADALRPVLFREVLHTRFGQVAMLRLVLLVLALPLLRRVDRHAGTGSGGRSGAAWAALAALGLVLLATPGLAGHGATGTVPWLGEPIDVVHLAAAGTWVAGLLLVTAAAHDRRRGRPAIAPRAVAAGVSPWALVSVALLVATGLVQSIRQVGSFYALFHTVYGTTLLVKVALVAVAVVLGAASRAALRGGWRGLVPARPRLRPAVPPPGRVHATGLSGRSVPAGGAGRTSAAVRVPEQTAEVQVAPPDGRNRQTVRLVLAEMAVLLAVLGVTGVLVNDPPARQAAAQPFAASVQVLGVQVNAVVAPARVGATNQFHFYVLGGLGQPRAIPELDATLALASAGIEGLTVPLQVAGPGHYTAAGVDLPVAGDWTLDVTVRTTAIDEQEVVLHVPVH